MLLLQITIAIWIAVLTVTPTQAAKQMNVLFILVDDLGYMDIGAYNPDSFYETPHIDAFAHQGMRFTHGYAANPVCRTIHSKVFVL